MIYKKVGRIEEEISSIGIGCWNFGGDWDSTEDGKSSNIIDQAIELGINFFDVAPVYGWGHSETILGASLKKNGKRNQVLIASKGGLLWDENHKTRHNLSKESLLKEIDDSLRRLQTDHVDVYQMHWPDHNVPLEETAEALSIMKKEGKIRYVGLSNFSQEDVMKMMDYVGVDCQQSLYNMLERNTDSYHSIPLEYRTEDEVLPVVRKYGQAFLPYSPLFQGLLCGKFHKGQNFSSRDIRNENPKLVGSQFESYLEGAERIGEVARKYNRPMNEIAMNWLRQNPDVTCIIGGASSPAQLVSNLHCLEWDIDDEMMAELNKAIEPWRNV